MLAGAMLAMSPGLVRQGTHFFTGRNVNTHLHAYDGVVLYLRENDSILCYDVRDKAASSNAAGQ